MKYVFLLSLGLCFSTYAEVLKVDFTGPAGKPDQVSIRSEAVDWVTKNVEGLDHLTDQKKTGLYYMISNFYDRIANLDALRTSYDELYAQMTPASVSYSPYFIKDGIEVMIMSEHDHVTDLPEYAHWRGKTVEDVFGYKGDLRLMDDIDGEATRNTCLLRTARVGNYPRGSTNTFYHEFGHFIHMTTMSKTEFAMVEKLYLAAKERNSFLDSYAAQSVFEYIAQGIEAYVSETKTDADRRGPFTKSGRAELQRIDPDLLVFIASIVETY